MFLPILSPTAGAILGIVLIVWLVSVTTKKAYKAISDEREAKKTPFYDLPFIYIEKHLISPDDEVLFPYLHNGKYKAIARNKRLGKWKRLEADDKIVLETMLRDTFIEWHKESEEDK